MDFNKFIRNVLNGVQMHSSVMQGHGVAPYSIIILKRCTISQLHDLYRGRCWYAKETVKGSYVKELNALRTKALALEHKLAAL